MNKLILLCGIPFSGKTTLARQLCDTYGYVRIDLDEIKFELYGPEVKDKDIDQEGWDKVYREMYTRIETALKSGVTVVHDTGNFTKHERGIVRNIADRQKLKTITVFVDTPVETARERMLQNRHSRKRFDVSDTDFNAAVAELEPPIDGEDEGSLISLESVFPGLDLEPGNIIRVYQ